MPNLRNRTWSSTDPAVVSDAQFWEDHLISDEDADFIQELKEGGVELGGHTIVNPQGQPMPKESKLKFLNAQVTDDPTNQQTIVDTRGEKGDSATITIGTVTTGEAGSEASVTNVGTSTDAIFNFSIPRGADGSTTIWGNITGNIQDQTDLQTALNNAGKVKTVNNIQPDSSGDVDLDASDIPYTNTTSGLTATDVQDAIDELSSRPSSSVWGSITGTLANQTDLQTELNSLQADIDSKGTVKSVNNVTPDAQGNVAINTTTAWGDITGTLANQTDLQNALNAKGNVKTVNNTSPDAQGNVNVTAQIDINQIYPVGSIYMSVNNTNPSTLFGGTWVQLKDRFLLGAGDTYTAGSTGGEAEHTLTEAELPNVTGSFMFHGSGGATVMQSVEGVFSSLETLNKYRTGGSDNNGATSIGEVGLEFGSDTPHNNMPPYLVVYMWQRTA